MSNFIENIKNLARQDKKTIVLAEGEEPRTVEAAKIILDQKIANLIMVGNKTKITELFGNSYSDLIQIFDTSNNIPENLIEELYELRKDKGLTLDQASKLLENPLYIGCMLVKTGKGQGMVAGAINSTSDVLRPALQILKTSRETKLVSAFFILVTPDKNYGENGTFIFADCGLNSNPTAEELSEIAISSAKSFRQLVKGTPKIAMLSYSTHGSAKGELINKIINATRMAKEKQPDLAIDGELQVDAAIVPEIASFKAPDSLIDGKANILIFPDLNSGNISYKLVQRLAHAEAYGPITQGISLPVNDLSRGCSIEDIVGVVSVTSVQAQMS